MSREEPEVKYYEIWDRYRSVVRLLRSLTLFSFFLCLALIIVLSMVAHKPPAVIAVNELGKAQFIRDYRVQDQRPTEGEVNYFVKTFLGNYIAPDSEKINDQMAQAMNFMTKSFQQIHLTDIRENNSIERITQANIKVSLMFKKVAITDQGEKNVFVEVTGIREIRPLESLQSDPKREGFRAKFRLARVSRSEYAPNGILVDDFNNEIVSLVTVEEGKGVQINVPDEKE